MHYPASAYLCILVSLPFTAQPVRASLYYSGDTFAPLPAQWKGFLADHRELRLAMQPPSNKLLPSLLRQEYQARYDHLLARRNLLTADELADAGALALRLGDFDQALNLLEAGARQHPRHFALRANLGTAWQLAGNLTQAAEHLTTAMELATPPQKKLEQLHLRLVLHRLRSPGTLDVLFPLEYSQGEQHKLGKLRSDELEKLPADAVALVQKLALSLPGDGLLLWQLGELACVYGDYASALEFLDLCLGEYGLTLPELRRSRQALQAQQESSAGRAPSRAAELHQKQHGSARLTFLSRRPFVPKPLDFSSLRSKRSDEPHLLVWPLLAETGHTPDRFAPRFHSYLNQLDNQTVVLMGFLHPLTDDLDCTSFLLVENPIGCWYCTAPDLTGMVFVSMKENTTTRFTRDVIQVTGKLKLNRHDPEEFLFNINQASVTTPR